MSLVSLYCDTQDLTVKGDKSVTCSQWVFQSASFWDTMTPADLSQLTQKILVLIFTGVMFWIVIHWINKL